MKWKSNRQRLCVSNETLSCIEFGMLNRKVHVTSSSYGAAAAVATAVTPTVLTDICETICLFIHKTQKSTMFTFFMCSFFPKRFRMSFMHCQHPCLMFTNQRQMKGKKAAIIINWCLMSHRKIYCIECKVENSVNVNGHKSAQAKSFRPRICVSRKKMPTYKTHTHTDRRR